MNNARDKYRIWDEVKKEYVSSRVFINHHGETCLIRTGCFYPNKCTKEHCTGKKDLNGKLIYEGDVLKIVSSGMYDDGEEVAVVWSSNAWGVCILKDGRYIEHDLPWMCSEIIGNIHEMEVEK